MKFYRLIVATAALCSLFGAVSLAEASDMGRGTMMRASMNRSSMHGRFGGPVYSGAPALAVTASLVAAGTDNMPGKNFSTAKALTSMVGGSLVNKEVSKLTKQYGGAKVTAFLKTFDFAVNDSLKIATAAGVKLPSADMSGKTLAATLVKAGVAQDGTFQIEYLLDKAVSHKIHVQVMSDIDAQPGLGRKADFDYHRISNQAFYDLAQALGATSVKLAAVH